MILKTDRQTGRQIDKSLHEKFKSKSALLPSQISCAKTYLSVCLSLILSIVHARRQSVCLSVFNRHPYTHALHTRKMT